MPRGRTIARSLLLCLILSPSTGQADNPTTKPEPQFLQRGNIRIFYQATGEHAVRKEDLNQNGIPDQVEDYLTQTEATKLLFVDLLGFPDPFHSPRYKEVRYLDIEFRSKKSLKSNALAFDRPQKTKRPTDPPGTLSLRFNLATNLSAQRNVSALHEYFHLIQYGCTQFKNAWFLEGTARWAEQGLVPPRQTKEAPLPWALSNKTLPQITVDPALFTLTYAAGARFWTPFLAQNDPSAALPEGPLLDTLRALTYIDGTPVLKNNHLPGWTLMRTFLIKFGEIDPLALKDQGYETWSKESRRSPRNNPYLLKAMAETLDAAKKEPPPTTTMETPPSPPSEPSPEP